METQIAYAFQSSQSANRFLNALKSGYVANVHAQFFKASDTVKVTYSASSSGFDRTTSELDELAERFDGREVSF
ncbi:hypothetical protein EYS14_04185 [Alteromonadaceae bacterium M269]|nr:hypothetical protein EYS14_04185 [Alteromonadaceae bacterium M269]